jgi:hypothetical protein
MFVVIDDFTSEEIKQSNEKECREFAARYNLFDGMEHYLVKEVTF